MTAETAPDPAGALRAIVALEADFRLTVRQVRASIASLEARLLENETLFEALIATLRCIEAAGKDVTPFVNSIRRQMVETFAGLPGGAGLELLRSLGVAPGEPS